MSKARDLASGDNGVRTYATSSGYFSVTGSASITFPASRFSVAPVISATVASTNNTGTSATTSTPTTSGCTIYVWSGTTASTTARNVYIVATQQTVNTYTIGTLQ